MSSAQSADKQLVAVGAENLLRERALLWLRTHVRTQRDWAERGRYQPGDDIVAAGNEGRLLAMEYVGAITPAEGAEWRERLREASAAEATTRPPVAHDVRNRAVSHLERVAAGVTSEPGDSFGAALSSVLAYERAGVLSAEEALAWRERVRAQMGLEPERPPLCSQRDLLAVHAGPVGRHQGVRITSVELYADGLVLRWHRAKPWPEGSDTPRIWSRVDQETESAINGGGWLVRLGSSSFTPAIPPAATHLRVPLAEGGIEITLTHD